MENPIEIGHLSASSINSYLDCGLQFKFAKIDKREPEAIAEALIFGTTIHKIIELYHHERSIGTRLSVMDVTAAFEKCYTEAFEQQAGKIQFKEGKDFDSTLLEGKSLLATYVTQFPETGLKVIGLEKAFSFQIEGVPIPIVGVMDMVEEDAGGNIVIVDHKTSSRSYSSDDIDKSLQLTIYGMAAKANGYGDREIMLRFDCLVKTKKPKFEQYYTVRTEEDELRAMKKIQAVYRGIMQGVFIPNDTSWKCKGCSYQQCCRDWFAN
ncbi:RecB family exonuclease [Solidesulfovibrio magneticus]|uniref:PD-(D/E)XK endonuclease-like domain-containing protein n=1 Tax=Solidesulfovibrio magneticus (strain ATCC 700980 / DSM 13731 / RS-1) TaxID=573370 RepID=C4XPY2_SOLM1|nr:PD-(D/E)XK nuclease family protein [Solidesulfovibrio magneticus]BAH77682.1 hypothetical protein DMR_41910 [Solidesulfovibrio magneticus RS-1]